MQDAYKQYMHWAFKQEFMDYPNELLDASCEYISEIEDVYISDIRAKHPEYGGSLDAGLFQLLQLDPTLEAIFYYRLSRAHYLSDENHQLLPFLSALMRRRTGMEIYYSTSIGSGFKVMHGVGSVVGPRYAIGNNFSLYQGVTIGHGRQYAPEHTVSIGDEVILFAGSKVLGNVVIGSNVQVGANSVVVNDLESNAVYAGVPARLIRKSS